MQYLYVSDAEEIWIRYKYGAKRDGFELSNVIYVCTM